MYCSPAAVSWCQCVFGYWLVLLSGNFCTFKRGWFTSYISVLFVLCARGRKKERGFFDCSFFLINIIIITFFLVIDWYSTVIINNNNLFFYFLLDDDDRIIMMNDNLLLRCCLFTVRPYKVRC